MLVSGQETRDLATPPRNSKSPYPPTIDKLNGWASLMSPLRQLIRRMLAFEPAQRISAAHAKGVVGTIWPPLLEGYELAVEDWGPRRKQASALVHDMRRHFRDEEAVKEGRPGEEGLRQGPVAEDVGPSRFWGRKENASPAEAEQDGLPVADGDATGAVVVDEADMLNTSSLLRALT